MISFQRLALSTLFGMLVVSCPLSAALAREAPPRAELLPQLGHGDAAIKAVAVSPDGRMIVTGSDDKSALLWDVASGRQIRRFTGHSANVNSVAFSPDGRMILTGSKDETARLWDVSTGKELLQLSDHTADVTSVAFSLDGRTALTGGRGGDSSSARLWDVAAGRELRRFGPARSSYLFSVAFSPDGKTALTGGLDKIARLWDVETGQGLREFIGHTGAVFSVAFSPDGRTVLTGSADKTARLWEVATGREVKQLLGHTDRVASVAFSPDGQTVLTGSFDKTARVWDATTGQGLRLFQSSNAFFSVAYLPNSQNVVTADRDKVQLQDISTGRLIRAFGSPSAVNSIALSRDGQTAISGSSDNIVRLWNISTGQLEKMLIGHSSLVTSAVFSPDGRSVLSGSQDKTLKLWDVGSGKLLKTFNGHQSEVMSVAFSPDGRLVLSGGHDDTMKLWDVASGRLIRSMIIPTRKPNEFEIRNNFWVHGVTSVSFSPDGKTALATTTVKNMSLWDVTSGRMMRTFTNPGDFTVVGTGAWSPDGQTALSASSSGLRLWEVATGRVLRTFIGRSSDFGSVAFAPDGRTALSGTNDFGLDLWDVSSGILLRTLKGHLGVVNGEVLSPDARLALSVSADGTIRIWDVANGAPVAIMMGFVDGEWLTITPEGFFDASSSKAAQNLNIVRGLEVSSVDQVYNALYRPDLVREKLAGDADGKVKAAAAKLDIDKVMASGSSPTVAITTPTVRTSSSVDEVGVEAAITDQGGGIGKVEWRVNGVTSGIETRGLERVESAFATPASGRTEIVKRTLALEWGENRIEVLAYNNKDLIASEPASVTVKWDGEKTAAPPKLYVMAVGVNDYYDSRLRLSYAVPDATAIAEGFRKAGNGLYAAVDVTTVLDKDVTIANLDKVFTELGKKAQPRDVFVFFLAGHGKTKNGRYYFLPRDFRYEDEDSIEKAGMDQDKFQAWFAKIPARKSILLYDTCESGSLTGTKARGSDIDERLGALNRMTRATGRTFLTATTDDAPALEGYRGHGVFTYALLDALEHADVNKNGLIEVSELADYIDRKVPDFSFEAFKLRQIPQRNIVGNNFPLANRAEVLGVGTVTAPAGRNAQGRVTPSPVAPPAGANSDKPTHVVTLPSDVFVETLGKGDKLQQLPAGTLVILVETERGWALVAKDGKRLGFVAEDHLIRVQ